MVRRGHAESKLTQRKTAWSLHKREGATWQRSLGHVRLKWHFMVLDSSSTCNDLGDVRKVSQEYLLLAQHVHWQLNALLWVVFNSCHHHHACNNLLILKRLYTRNTPPKHLIGKKKRNKSHTQTSVCQPGSFLKSFSPKHMLEQIHKATGACEQTWNPSDYDNQVAMLHYFKDAVVFIKEMCTVLQSPGCSTLLAPVCQKNIFQRTPIYIQMHRLKGSTNTDVPIN